MTPVAEGTDFELRPLSSDEITAAAPSVQEWLEFPPGTPLAESYPHVYRPEGGARAIGAVKDGALCSHTAYRRVVLQTNLGPLRTTLIGDVATAQELRGQRMASRILQHIAGLEQEDGQEALILWSDLWDFYARLGFAPASVQAEVVIKAETWADPTAVRLARAGDLVQLCDLHRQKPWRVDRDLAEFALLLSTPATDCFVLERDSEVVAYVVHGKGIDLQGWWHEMGGSDRDVATLLPHALARLQQGQATVIVPPYRGELLELLEPLCQGLREGIVGLCKPLSENALCEFFIDGLDSI